MSATVTELAALREKLDELREENRQLRELLTPACFLPHSWGLTKSQQKLLLCLASRGGNAIERDTIMATMYRDWHERDPKIIDVFVSHCRRKLKPHGIGIRCHWGIGYSLTAEDAAKVRAASRPEIVAEAA